MNPAPTFPQDSKYDRFYKAFRKAVQAHFSALGQDRFGNGFLWFKASFYIGVSVASYALLFLVEPFWAFCIFYVVHGTAIFLLNLNLSHDAAHHCLFRNKKLNNVIFDVFFHLMGSSAYIWKRNHVKYHHHVPNIEGADPDMIVTDLIRFTQNQKWRPMHRYQWLYAPVLYMLHSPIYYFITDFLILFGIRKDPNFPLKERMKALFFKIVHAGYVIVLPIVLLDFAAWQVILAFVGVQMVYSLFLVFGLGIPHLNHEAQVYTPNEDNALEQSWVEVQIFGSLDFNPQGGLTHWLLGGFNTHVMHHLLPGVNHIHYQKLMPVLENLTQEYDLPYTHVTWTQIVRSHFKMLKELGREPDVDHSSMEVAA